MIGNDPANKGLPTNQGNRRTESVQVPYRRITPESALPLQPTPAPGTAEAHHGEPAPAELGAISHGKEATSNESRGRKDLKATDLRGMFDHVHAERRAKLRAAPSPAVTKTYKTYTA